MRYCQLFEVLDCTETVTFAYGRRKTLSKRLFTRKNYIAQSPCETQNAFSGP